MQAKPVLLPINNTCTQRSEDKLVAALKRNYQVLWNNIEASTLNFFTNGSKNHYEGPKGNG